MSREGMNTWGQNDEQYNTKLVTTTTEKGGGLKLLFVTQNNQQYQCCVSRHEDGENNEETSKKSKTISEREGTRSYKTGCRRREELDMRGEPSKIDEST